jgi:hypothetical protein
VEGREAQQHADHHPSEGMPTRPSRSTSAGGSML